MYFFRIAAFTALALSAAACGAHKNAESGSASTSVAAQPTLAAPETPEISLGAPVYPSAKANGSIATTPHGTMAAFMTSDPFAAVYAYYKTHLPASSQAAKVLTGTAPVAAFELGDVSATERTTVTISGKPGRTDIVIMHETSSEGSASPEATE